MRGQAIFPGGPHNLEGHSEHVTLVAVGPLQKGQLVVGPEENISTVSTNKLKDPLPNRNKVTVLLGGC